VVVVDADQVGDDVRDALRKMEAFITKGGRDVYLTRHGAVLQGALKEWTLHEHILATIIWHEMAHIEGADEIEAQRREEALLMDYIMADRVDRRGDALSRDVEEPAGKGWQADASAC
jgi:predicted Zn-dependent protease